MLCTKISCFTPANTHAHTTPTHIHAHPHTPAHIPHIPTYCLNLINHMKLYIDMPNTERGIER